ncbi:MAG TPA: OmpA family protein [Candidatus Sulfotelmatobacter sp.]
MKNRALITFLLATALAPSVFTQTKPGSGAPPAAIGRQSVHVSSSQSDQPHDFWDGDEPSLAALIFHPFASKAYVRRHMQSVQDRINELEQLTAANRKAINDVDARSRQGIRMASERVNLADQHATDASNQAQMAQQAARALNTRVAADETLVGSVDQFKAASQTEIHFRPGQTVLSRQSKDALDAIAAQVKGQHGYIVEIQGFSSGQGQTAIANSRTMANSVVRYFVLNHEIPAYRIFVIGMGNVSGEKRGTGTRVEISLLQNNLPQTAQK